MTLPQPISNGLAEQIAERLRAIGDPTRIRILDQLRGGDFTVTELAERLGTSQQNASKHLGLLLAAGIVSRRKLGNRALYSVADRSVHDLCEGVCGSLEARFASLQSLLGERR